MDEKWRTSVVLLVASFLLSVPVAVHAQLAPPAAPTDPASARYTLGDIWNRLSSGTPGSLRAGAFLEPAAGPATVSTKSTNEVMAAAPVPDNTNGAVEAMVLKGMTFWGLRTSGGTWGLQSGTMTNRGAVTITPGQSSQAILAGYHNGSGTVVGDTDLRPTNVRAGVNLFGVTGSVLRATGDAAVADVLSGKTFSNATAAGLTGTMPNRGAVTITPGTTNQPIAAGYHDGSGTVAGDADLVAGNVKSGVNLFGVAGSHPLAGVPKTGAMDCVKHDGTSWVEDVGCTTNMPPGQDGALRKGVAWPSPRFADNGNGTVTDNLTGLIWLKNAGCWKPMTSPMYPTWEGALVAAATLNSGECGLTDGSVEGDWRLPNRRELLSLVHQGYEDPALSNAAGTGQWVEGDPFTDVMANGYWTSSSTDGAHEWAYVVSFQTGEADTDLRAAKAPVWPVRGGQP